MQYREKYQQWLHSDVIDIETKRELLAIGEDEPAIEDRFFTDLEFGTGGMRGRLGAGTNRINRYTLRMATQGLANYLLEQVSGERSVVIAYDTRRCSRELAAETAAVLNGNGIRAYLFAGPRPTPELSFAVRELRASAGIVITASHNPPEYNGYKVYGPDGCQIVSEAANAIVNAVKAVTDLAMVQQPLDGEAAHRNGLLQILGEEMDTLFLTAVKAQLANPKLVAERGSELKIAYSPLHGTGLSMIGQLFDQVGFSSLSVVEAQAVPDPAFSTVRVPNPEDPGAFELAIQVAKDLSADIILATDPDADRVGVMVKDDLGEYVLLNGNQTGALLLDYILRAKQASNELDDGATVVKTIVTSELGRSIARHYAVTMMDTLTGFKYIGEKIREFEETGDRSFIFGFEESFGYLAGTHARDKDAVVASLLVAEMALTYRLQGLTLLDALDALQQRHGYHRERLLAWTFEGKQGQALITSLMHQLRLRTPENLAGMHVTEVRDYLRKVNTDLDLPKENTIKLMLERGAWVCVRPSGTEPKIKFYLAAVADSAEQATQQLDLLEEEVQYIVAAAIRAEREAAASAQPDREGSELA